MENCPRPKSQGNRENHSFDSVPWLPSSESVQSQASCPRIHRPEHAPRVGSLVGKNCLPVLRQRLTARHSTPRGREVGPEVLTRSAVLGTDRPPSRGRGGACPQAAGLSTHGGGSYDRRARSKLRNRKTSARPGQEHGRENTETGIREGCERVQPKEYRRGKS